MHENHNDGFDTSPHMLDLIYVVLHVLYIYMHIYIYIVMNYFDVRSYIIVSFVIYGSICLHET